MVTKNALRGKGGILIFLVAVLSSCHSYGADSFPNGFGGLTARIVNGQIRIEEFDCSGRVVGLKMSFYQEPSPTDIREDEDRFAVYDLGRTIGSFSLTLNTDFLESSSLKTFNMDPLAELVEMQPGSQTMVIMEAEIDGTPLINLLWIDVSQLMRLAAGDLTMNDGFERPVEGMCGAA